MSEDPSLVPAIPFSPTIDVEDIPEEFRHKVVDATGDIPQHIDFFDSLDSYKYEFPDGVQVVWLKVFNEGDRRNYLAKTNREVRMNAQTREMRLNSNAAEDLHALLGVAITGWTVFRGGKELQFDQRTLTLALDAWPPSLIDKIADKVREINPWLAGDDSLEAMEEEYADLGRRIEAEKARQGK